MAHIKSIRQGLYTAQGAETECNTDILYYFFYRPHAFDHYIFANLVWKRQAVEGEVYKQFSGLVGNDAALQIQEIIKNASVSEGIFTAIIGFATLIVAAISLFTEMHDSLNMIWNLKVKAESKGWRLILRSRLLSFSITASLGFYCWFPWLLIVCLMVL